MPLIWQKPRLSFIPPLNYASVADAQIVVEAVVENPKVKASVLAETEALLADHAVLASNTSTIPISLLAKSLTRPLKISVECTSLIPFTACLLVEIIKGEKPVKRRLIALSVMLAKWVKRQSLLMTARGSFVNRVLFPLFRRIFSLLRDGADFLAVDKVMEKSLAGPMGPAYLLDVVGIDTANHAQAVMVLKVSPDRMGSIDKDVIALLYQQQRYGQKNNHGFYDYTIDKRGKKNKSR